MYFMAMYYAGDKHQLETHYYSDDWRARVALETCMQNEQGNSSNLYPCRLTIIRI